jgi:hypothetical protein
VNILWTVVVYIFLLGTLGAVALGILTMLGGGPRAQH